MFIGGSGWDAQALRGDASRSGDDFTSPTKPLRALRPLAWLAGALQGAFGFGLRTRFRAYPPPLFFTCVHVTRTRPCQVRSVTAGTTAP